ncbi:hypothetical protein ACJIZ3_008482 [Penstemon smallii]|uniref:Protein kinase domain-containing protein n=1 Tax=Penstemon smallii TaxID=265156 RepID=A0ABD3TAU7_9LAMI
MAYISTNFLLFFFTISSISFHVIFTATVIEDLNNLQPPPDFNSTITKNCITNPYLRYCNSIPFNLDEIFKSTIVASHLCNISNNTNCVESFPKIDLHSQPKIAPLYLSFTFFWKYCPLTLTSINLSNNSLKGNFPSDIFHCSQIEKLDLSHNNLSGDLPVQNFYILENLTFLNLSYNDFSESKISDKHFFERFNSMSFICSGILPNHKHFRIKAVLLLIGFPVFVISMVVFLGWLCFWRPDFLPRFLQRRNEFTMSILKAATDGFSKRNLVGKTGTVSVYKGVLRNGSEVRIEIYLDNMSRENRRRFVEKSKILVQLSHDNIVPILGWCDNRRFRALITEWIGGENIETWLSNSAPQWKQRVKVILRVALVVCYLHEEWPEVGYNLKTRNVLISENGEPMITNFRIDDHHCSAKKIYKFGMFILEMVTNKRPGKEFEKGESGFVEWVKLNYPDNMEDLIDKRMKKNGLIVSQCAEVIGFGLICTDISNGQRPSWNEILDLISSTLSIESASPDRKRLHLDSKGGHKHAHYRGSMH